MKMILTLCLGVLTLGIFNLYAEQKIVLISGATGGIGKAAIEAFQEDGWKIWAGYRTPPEHAENNPNIRWIYLDVTRDETIEKVVATIIEEDGKIDALINNAGYGIIGIEEAVSIEEAQQLFDVNFFGAFKLMQRVIPHMQSRHSGHIINISSTSGVRALPGLGFYAASKFALEGLSEGLSATLSPWNIHVVIVEPGTVKNDFAEHCLTTAVPSEHPFAQKLTQNLANKLMSIATTGQECLEIGRMLVNIAKSPKPDFRYQTSPKVCETLAKKLVDPSGNAMREEQVSFLKSLID